MKKLFIIALFIIFLVVGLLLGTTNLQSIDFNLYWITVSMPLALFTAITLLFGILVSWISFSFRIFSLKRENSRLQRNLEKAITKEE